MPSQRPIFEDSPQPEKTPEKTPRAPRKQAANPLLESARSIAQKVADLEDEVAMLSRMEESALEQVRESRDSVAELMSRLEALVLEGQTQIAVLRNALQAIDEAFVSEQRLQQRLSQVLAVLDAS